MNWRENKGSKPSRSSSKGRPANPPAGPPKEPTDWRSKKSLLGGKESKKKGKAWVTKEIDPTSIRRATNLLRNGLILLVLTVSIVVFVIWMLQTRSRVQFVLVAPNDTSGGTWHSTKDYNDTMRAAFRKANEYNRNLDVIDSKTTNAFFDTKNSWTEAVAEIKLQLLGPNNDLSVFYFSGPTAVKGSGEKARPYFLPATADPLEDFGNWIDVEKLLGDIADTATTNGIGQKLVFIDALRVEPITSVGLSYDRFLRAVVAALNRLGKNNLHVIISHDNGQRNWVLPEVGMTAFGYMVQRGLMGEADGLLNANQEVSFGELVDYLRRAVFGFVKDARQSVQTPLVISPVFNAGKVDRDFGVVYIDRSGFSKWRSAEATESKSIDLLVSRVKQRSGDLLESWKEYKAKEQSGALNRFPLWSADAAALLIRWSNCCPRRNPTNTKR